MSAMKVKSILLTGACALTLGVKAEQPAPVASEERVRYEANWESLDKRPIQQWYRDAKFGIIIHWGPYSVPAFAPADQKGIFWRYSEQYQGHLQLLKNKAFQKHHSEKYHDAPYANFAAQFKAENYNPGEWADLFKRAGAKYAMLTSKHHDGFTLWPSPNTPYYNAVAMGPGRDLAGDFITAMRTAGLKCGFYFSVKEFLNPRYLEARRRNTLPQWSEEVNFPQMKDLVERYKIDIFCPDGEWDDPGTCWKSVEFLQWLFNESSMRDTIVVGDRWGKDCRGNHGGYWTCEYAIEGLGREALRRGMPQEHPWEEWRALGWSFGWNKFEQSRHYMTESQCIERLVWCVSGGGNLVLDVGPTPDGRIPVIMQDRLLAMGRWLDVNGEAIYGSRIWWTKDYESAKANRLYFTRQGETVYAITFRWPDAARPITMHDVGKVKGVTLVGAPDAKVDWREEGGTLTFTAAPLAPDTLPCQHAWTFKVAR